MVTQYVSSFPFGVLRCGSKMNGGAFNPNNGVFQLRSINNKPLFCSLLDIEGRIVYNENIKPTNYTYNFNFSAVSKGLYTLRVVNDNEVLNLKLVIK